MRALEDEASGFEHVAVVARAQRLGHPLFDEQHGEPGLAVDLLESVPAGWSRRSFSTGKSA